jgi:hypothetical protein
MDFGIFIPDFVRRAFFIGVSCIAHPSSIVHCSITYRRIADGSTGNVATSGQASFLRLCNSRRKTAAHFSWNCSNAALHNETAAMGQSAG